MNRYKLAISILGLILVAVWAVSSFRSETTQQAVRPELSEQELSRINEEDNASAEKIVHEALAKSEQLLRQSEQILQEQPRKVAVAMPVERAETRHQHLAETKEKLTQLRAALEDSRTQLQDLQLPQGRPSRDEEISDHFQELELATAQERLAAIQSLQRKLERIQTVYEENHDD